jgi:hypothetical protein
MKPEEPLLNLDLYGHHAISIREQNLEYLKARYECIVVRVRNLENSTRNH